MYAGDEFEWDPFSDAAPSVSPRAEPAGEIPTGTLAELLGDVIRREPVAEYVAWRRSGPTWIVERMSAEHMEVLRLSAPNPNHPSWRRDYDRVARGRVLRSVLRGLPTARPEEEALDEQR